MKRYYLENTREDEDEHDEDFPRMSLSSTTAYPHLHVVDGTNRPIVQVGFWGAGEAEGQEDWYLGRLASCWTRVKDPEWERQGLPSFTHCEIRFSNGMVCSILETNRVPDPLRWNHFKEIPGVVHCRNRPLDRRKYWFIEFDVSYAQHETMFNAAMDYAARKVPFNQAGMRLNFVWPFSWWPFDRQGEAFFCSELIVTLMQKVQLLPLTVRACTTSPNALWIELNKLPNACSSMNRNENMDAVLATLEVPRKR